MSSSWRIYLETSSESSKATGSVYLIMNDEWMLMNDVWMFFDCTLKASLLFFFFALVLSTMHMFTHTHTAPNQVSGNRRESMADAKFVNEFFNMVDDEQVRHTIIRVVRMWMIACTDRELYAHMSIMKDLYESIRA